MKLRLLQWNIWHLEKIEKVLEVLQSIDADIICLQELTTNSTVNTDISTGKYLQDHLDYHAAICTAQSWKNWEKDSQENGIFSRYPITNFETFFLRSPHAPDLIDYSKEGRVYIEAEIEIAHKKLFVATTHMSYAHRFEPGELRQEEDRKLLELLKRDKDFVFAADLNADHKSKLVKKLSNRYHHAGPDTKEKTWTTKPFDYNGFQEKELNWRLDYLFTSKDLQVLKSEIIQTEVSDHLPVLVEFELC